MIRRSIALVGATLVTAFAIAHVFAAAPDIATGIQFIDHGCTGGIGQFSMTASANSITGAATSQWAADSNYYDPDCVRVLLQKSTAALNKDVRVCVQVGDTMSPNLFGVITNVSQVGENRCTPWATDGGGWSGWAYDTNGDDPDGARLTLETRAIPSGKQIEDIRLGIQTGDHKCDRRLSTAVYTPWATDGGGWSGWASGGADPNCFRLELQSRLSQTAACTTPVPASSQPKINLSDIQYVTAVRSGATVCPAGRVFVGVDQQDHASIIRMKCAASSNLLATGATTDVPLTVDIIRGNWSATNNCPAGHIINGVVQDADGRETAIRCQPVIAGTVDFSYAPGGVGTHGRSGDRYEVNFNESKAGEWVAFGAIYNKAPYSSRGIAGYQLKPRTDLPPTPNACETPACVNGGRSLTSPISTTQSTAPVGSSAGGDKLAGSACAGDKLHSTVATSFSTKQFAAGTCAATTPGFFTSTNLTKINKPSNPNATPAKCPSGFVIAEFTELGISCRPLAGGAGALVSGSERTIAVGSGTAVNNYFNLFVNGSNKTWAATGVEYDFGATGVPPKSVTVMEVRTAPSCTPLPVPPPDPAPIPSSTPVDPIPNPNPNPNPPAPTCTLTATPATIVLNVGSSRLTWNCTGSGTVTISAVDNADFVAVSGQPAQGGLNVAPDKTTTFKVTLGAASTTATVTVGGSVIDETGGL